MDTNILNTITLNARGSIFNLSDDSNYVTEGMLDVLTVELLCVGYALTDNSKNALLGFSKKDFQETVDILYKYTTESVGADVYHNTLFTNFPNIQPDKANVQFVSSAVNDKLLALFSEVEDTFGVDECVTDTGFVVLDCGHKVNEHVPHDICPVCTRTEASVHMSPDALDFMVTTKPKLIDVIGNTEFNDIVSSMLSSKSGMSDEQKESIEQYLLSTNVTDCLTILPENIPFKETVSFLVATLFKTKITRGMLYNVVLPYVKTANDVMRIAEDLNHYDDSETFKLSTSKRKFIVSLLNSIKSPDEDMLSERDKWIALNMAVHFGEFKTKYPKMFESVDRVFNKPDSIITFNSRFERCVYEKDIDGLIKLCKSRPGVLGRNVDHLVRKFPESTEKIIHTLIDVGESISMRVLVTLRNNFASRKSGYEGQRMFTNKKGFVQNIDTKRENIDETTCDKVINGIDTVIKNKLYDSTVDGQKMWIDAVLDNYKIPLKMRSLKNTMNKAERGSHIQYNKTDVDIMRMFIYWKENANSGRVDLDLSAMVCDERFNGLGECAYYSVFEDILNMQHSGDVTSAPNGASEFIDVDLRDKGAARYILMYVNVYSNQKLDDFDAFCGVMFLNGDDTSKIYHPEKVTERFDLTSDATSVLCYVYDIESNKMVWADMSGHTKSASNMSNSQDTIKQKVEFLMNENETALSMGAYFKLYAESNNLVFVDNKDDADLVIDNKIINNTDEFNSKWMV